MRLLLRLCDYYMKPPFSVDMLAITRSLVLVMFLVTGAVLLTRRSVQLKVNCISSTWAFLHFGSICPTQAVNPQAFPASNTSWTDIILGGLLALTLVLVNGVTMVSGAETNDEVFEGQDDNENQDADDVANIEQEHQLDMSPDMEEPVVHVQWIPRKKPKYVAYVQLGPYMYSHRRTSKNKKTVYFCCKACKHTSKNLLILHINIACDCQLFFLHRTYYNNQVSLPEFMDA